MVQKLSATPPSGWDSESVAALKGGMAPTAKGLPQKLLFGSDFPYRDADTHVPASYEGIGLRPSLALGGLSNVWGAALMPYADSDLGEWAARPNWHLIILPRSISPASQLARTTSTPLSLFTPKNSGN